MSEDAPVANAEPFNPSSWTTLTVVEQVCRLWPWLGVSSLILVIGIILLVCAGGPRWEAAQAYLLLVSLAGIAWTVYYTMRGVEYARRTVDVSQEAMEADYRPALVIQWDDEHLRDDGQLRLNVRNVGSGPALNVVPHEPAESAFEFVQFPVFPAIAVGEQSRAFRVDLPSGSHEGRIAVRYMGLSGHRYISRQRFLRTSHGLAPDTGSIHRACCIDGRRPNHPPGEEVLVSAKNLEQRGA